MINFKNHGPINKTKKYVKGESNKSIYIYSFTESVHVCMHTPRNPLLVRFFYANFSLAVFPSVFCDTLWKLTTAQSHMLLHARDPETLRPQLASSSVAQRLAINTGGAATVPRHPHSHSLQSPSSYCDIAL